MSVAGRSKHVRSDLVDVNVKSFYLAEQSSPGEQRFVFAYRVRIANQGDKTVQLLRRHWIIQDGLGETEEVEGEGVVGQQPVIAPGEAYEYTSGCVLKTDCGAMCGSYQMLSADGRQFEAPIPTFTLRVPGTLH